MKYIYFVGYIVKRANSINFKNATVDRLEKIKTFEEIDMISEELGDLEDHDFESIVIIGYNLMRVEND
jgi:hypothetical protein